MRKTEGKRRSSNCAEKYLQNECSHMFADMSDMFRWIIHFLRITAHPGSMNGHQAFHHCIVSCNPFLDQTDDVNGSSRTVHFNRLSTGNGGDSKFLKIRESIRMLVCDSDSNPKRTWKKSTNWPRNSMSSRKKQTHFTTVLSPCECPATTMGRSPVSNRNCSKALRMSWNATSQLPPMPASMVRHQICQIASKYYSQK